MRWIRSAGAPAISGLVCLAGSLWLIRGAVDEGFRHATTYPLFDSSFYVYVNAWVAYALTHLHNPLFTMSVNAPSGMNLLATPYDAGLALLAFPVTLIVGPVAALNVQLVLIPVVNAIAMTLAIRPWVKRPWLSAVAGIIWGLSPFVVSAEVVGWTNISFLVYPPVVLALLSDLFVFQRHRPRTIGIWLALATAIQFFISGEILAITVSATVVALAVIGLRGLTRRDTLASLRRAAVAAAWGLPLSALLLAWPVYEEFRGPGHVGQWVRGPGFLRSKTMPLSKLIWGLNAPQVKVPNFSNIVPNPYLLGPALVLVVLAAVWLLRRHSLGVPLLAAALFALWLERGSGSLLSPESLVLRLPLIRNVTITRFVIVDWLVAVVALTLVADRVIDWFSSRRQRMWGHAAAALLVIVSVVAPAAAVGARGTMTVSDVQTDAALSSFLTSPGEHLVLTFPAPIAVRGMFQQATTADFSYGLSGGASVEVLNYANYHNLGDAVLQGATKDWFLAAPTPEDLRAVVKDLQGWGTTDAVVPLRLAPGPEFGPPYQLVGLLTELLGTPTEVDSEWVWQSIRPAVPATALNNAQWGACVAITKTELPGDIPSCVSRALAANGATSSGR